MFLWSYIRKSLYIAPFERFAEPFGDGAFLVTVLAALACAVAVGACAPRLGRLLDRPLPVFACGMVGSTAIGIMGCRLLAPHTGIGVAVGQLACCCAVAVSFCGLFFAWSREIHRQAFTFGLGVEIALLVCSIVLSFLLSSDLLDDTVLEACDTVGCAVVGACLWAVRRLRKAKGNERGEGAETDSGAAGATYTGPDADSASEGQLKGMIPWLGLLSVSLLVVGFLSYIYYFDEDYDAEAYDAAYDILLFVALALVVAFALYTNHASSRRKGIALPLVLGLVFAAFLIFFILMFTFTVTGSFSFGLPRFIRRISRVVAFVAVLAIVYQYGLSPVRTFAFTFLVPSLLPKPVQVALSTFAPGISGVLGQDYVLVALMATGFFMTACLVVFCLVNIDGRLARTLLADQELSGEEDAAAPDRRAVCEKLGKRYDLTRRETDVLYYFSAGQSAQKTAMALSISVNTVNTHAMGLYRKLGVHAKQEVVDLVEHEAAGQ